MGSSPKTQQIKKIGNFKKEQMEFASFKGSNDECCVTIKVFI